MVKNALAVGSVSPDTAHVSNFGQLHIQTLAGGTDEDLAYAAGVLEGALTSERITQATNNLYCQINCTGSVPAEITTYLDEQLAWTEAQIASNPDDPYWSFNSVTLQQWKGLMEGYAQTAADPVADVLWAMRLVNFVGDLFDIKPAVLPQNRPKVEEMEPEEITAYMRSTGHCSAILRVADDLSDIFFGHSSWFVYSNMLRYYKTYDFTSLKVDIPSKRTSFSSYPGMISSLDDFYLNHDTGLSMLQTTNNVFNTKLYDLIVPETLPAWFRVRAANALAETGEEWYETVKRENSGTYNNQVRNPPLPANEAERLVS